MKKIISLFIFTILFSCNSKKGENIDFTTLFEKSNGTETPEYKDVISFYEKLVKSYDEISLFEIGETDSGKPLHLIVFNSDGKTDLNSIKTQLKIKY